MGTKIISCLLLLSINVSFGQVNPSFFSKLKPVEQSSLFLFSTGYRIPLNKNIMLNSGHGVYLEAGINPGYFISEKLVFGLYGGWAWRDGLWNTSFNKDFVNDYNTSINDGGNLNPLDSSVVSSSGELLANASGRALTLPGCEAKSFHNYSLYYGIMVRLPGKYVPTLKAYMGNTRSSFHGNNIATKGKEYNIYQLRRAMYGFELIIFRGLQSAFRDDVFKRHLNRNIGVLSIYYESCDLGNASLYFDDGEENTTISLRKYLSGSFTDKYRKEVILGVKVSFCIM